MSFRWHPNSQTHLVLKYYAVRALDRQEPFLWHSIVGPGGVGKSRFTLELGEVAHLDGWRVGFLPHTADSDIFKAKNSEFTSWKPAADTLLIVDYASFYSEGLTALLADLARALKGHSCRLRILLADREGGINRAIRGYSQNETADTPTMQALSVYHDPKCLRGRKFDEQFSGRLPAVPREQWLGFLKAVMEKAGVDQEKIQQIPTGEDFLDEVGLVTGNGLPLMLQLLGIEMVREEDLKQLNLEGDSRDAILDRMLSREIEQRWSKYLEAEVLSHNGEFSPLLNALQRAIACITLCRGMSYVDFVKREQEITGVQEDRLYEALQQILPPERDKNEIEWFPPLTPDLFAERFVIHGGHYIKTSRRDLSETKKQAFAMEDIVKLCAEYAPLQVFQFSLLVENHYPEPADLLQNLLLENTSKSDDAHMQTALATIIGTLSYRQARGSA